MSKNLTVVICHGSYHSPAPYQPLIRALQSRGIDAYCPQRPTCDLTNLNVGSDIHHPDFDRPPPESGYPSDTDDVNVVLTLVTQLVRDGKRVLLAGHSSGGWVASQAAIPAVQATASQPRGVIGIFYIGAFVIPVGESVHSFFQPAGGEVIAPPFMEFHKHGPQGLGTIVDAPRFLFNDLDHEDAQKWTATLTASPIMATPLTNNPYRALPCAYLVLENDRTLPCGYQEKMAELQTQAGGSFTMYRAPAGHSPHLSWTEGLVDRMEAFVESLEGDHE